MRPARIFFLFNCQTPESYDIHTADFKEKQKMLSFLYRKGFDSSKIRKALQYEDIF